MFVTKEFKAPPHPEVWESMATANCLVTNITQNIYFICVQKLKEIHTGLEQPECE